MKDNITETTEKLYNNLKKYISAHTNIPQDIRQQFQKLTYLRKVWQKELRGGALDEAEEGHWIDIELGVHIMYDKNITLSNEIIPEIIKAILKEIPELDKKPNKFKKFISNPFNLEVSPFLPIPSNFINQKWDKDTLTIRYYYESEPEVTTEQIRKWWNLWDNYHEYIGYVWINENNDKNRKAQIWVNADDILSFEGDTEHQTSLFISRIITSEGDCYALGHCLQLECRKNQDRCEKLEQFA